MKTTKSTLQVEEKEFVFLKIPLWLAGIIALVALGYYVFF